MIGVIDDIEVSRLGLPLRPLRSDSDSVKELADSINQKGLLQPLVVRIKDGGSFEIVAGWRRFHACKILGWRKMPCHVVELDDREAFEISLIENVQRNSLNPIDEGRAFKNYVQDYGWGGVSDLARKIGKSVSYVTKRIQILDLPSNVIESVANSDLSPSIAEELCRVKAKERQSKIAETITKEKLSLRKSREIVKIEISENFSQQGMQFSTKTAREVKHEKAIKALERTTVLMKITMNRMVDIIEDSEDNQQLYKILLKHKNLLHDQIDQIILEKKKLSKMGT